MALFRCTDSLVESERPERSMLRRYAAVTSGVLALACSGSRPREGVVDSSSVDFTNAIEYRALTRADFLSSTRPEIDSEGYVIRAYTCTMLMATPDTWINAVSRQTPAGEPAFGVTFKALGFRALMNRDCSWWNDEGTVDAAYVLEHEQIHFAISELGARHLNANATQIASELEGKPPAASDTDALKRAQAAVERVLIQQGALVKARDVAFDNETSYGFNPERQKLWLGQVNAELVASAAWASAPRAYYQR
jgi:hypothetical protein